MSKLKKNLWPRNVFDMVLLNLSIGLFLILAIHQTNGVSAAGSSLTNNTLPLTAPLIVPETLANVDPDPRFRWVAAFGTRDLDYISLLMNAVNGQAILAHQAFGTRIKGVWGIMLENYKNVNIDITPRLPGRNFENRIAIWGLYSAIRHMAVTRTFKEARFDLLWDDNIVAIIIISTLEGARSSHISSVSAYQADFSNASFTRGEGLQPGFRFLPNGAKLALQEVFMTVLSTLQILAYWNDTEVVYPYTSRAEGFDCILQVTFGGAQRTSPPFLLVTYVIDTVRSIPRFMMQGEVFAELMAVIIFKGVIIGEALLYRSPWDQSKSILVS